MRDLLDDLNPAQREAAAHLAGPLLVVAGAGAGKTKTITYRIANLIRGGAAPHEILAVTFTNKAAREMRERALALLAESAGAPGGEGAPFVATFHALGVALLREHAALAGIPRRFAIFDRQDSLRAVRDALKELGYDPKEFEPRRVLGAISRAKGDGLGREAYAAEAAGSFAHIAAEAWERYERSLAEDSALDFDDLLLRTKQLLERHGEVREKLRARWRYLHIDEYQDTNRVQDEIAALLVGEGRNICVVGDVDQNVYGWRGADIKNLLHFEKRYPGARVVTLEQNYRSTRTIVAAANEVIAKNRERLEKNLYTDNERGECIACYAAADEADEARFAARRAEALIRAGAAPREIAVLYRANFQSRIIEEQFLLAEIPYQVLGTRFFERREVKDVLSFIRLARNPESIADLKRVVNVPPRGIGKVTLLKMVEGRENELSGKLAERVARFRAHIRRISEESERRSASALVKFVLAESGLEERLAGGSEEDAERLENIRELVTLAAKYDAEPPPQGADALLENAALASDQDALAEERETVKLMTVHAAKGLEFDYVFITGLEEDLFPHASETRAADSEEERRLFYVALTRARKRVFLSFASVRTIFGAPKLNTPSSFISDISGERLEAFAAGTEEPNEPHGRRRDADGEAIIEFD